MNYIMNKLTEMIQLMDRGIGVGNKFRRKKASDVRGWTPDLGRGNWRERRATVHRRWEKQWNPWRFPLVASVFSGQ